MALSNMYGPARTLIDADYLRIGSHLISPFDSARVQPASYDVTLGPKVLCPKTRNEEFNDAHLLDLRTMRPSDLMYEDEITERGWLLPPRACALVSTAETVSCPTDMTCSVDGKSTLGRCFLAVHVTAGFIDPGFVGNVTLELVNHGPFCIVLYPGMPIGQVRFTWLAVQVDKPYGSPGLGSHYQGTVGVRAAEPLGVVVQPPVKRSPHWCEGCGE
jgi:dCTP deaminase